MLAVPWLCIDGVEVVNHARTLTYLRRGLGGGRWRVAINQAGLDFMMQTIGYDDIYDDIYVGDEYIGDPYSPSHLVCYCPQTSDNEYVSPAFDEAPWYVESKPASTEFLGLLLLDMVDRPPTQRSMVRWSTGGSGLGPKSPGERSAEFGGLLVATTPAGMQWGRRWLADVLNGGMCDDERGSEITFLPSCPDDADALADFRRYVRATLADGPNFSRVGDNTAECFVSAVQWQTVAGVPWLLGKPEDIELLPSTLGAGQSDNWLIESNEWNGDVAGYMTITAGAFGATDIQVTAYPLAEGQTCPEDGTPNPCHAFHIDTLPAHGVVEIDSGSEDARYYNPTSKSAEPAWPLLDFDKYWTWLGVPPCSAVCVQVTNNGSSVIEVTVQKIAREI